jgi:hypothetical protein
VSPVAIYSLYPVIRPATPVESASAAQVTAIDAFVEDKSTLVGADGEEGNDINPTLKVLLKAPYPS